MSTTEAAARSLSHRAILERLHRDKSIRYVNVKSYVLAGEPASVGAEAPTTRREW